jgi:hypothetical protein
VTTKRHFEGALHKSAHTGRGLVLGSDSERMLCDELARRITYQELTVAPNFASAFARGLKYPELELSDRVAGAYRPNEVI